MTRQNALHAQKRSASRRLNIDLKNYQPRLVMSVDSALLASTSTNNKERSWAQFYASFG